MAAAERAAPAAPAEPKPPPGLGKAVQVFAKLLSGDSFTLNCPLDARVDFVKRLVEWKATINGRDLPAGCQRLIFAGKNLEDHHTLEGKRVVKESTLHVVDTRGFATTMEEKETFDGTDGFIVTSKLDVAPAQRWLLDNQDALSRSADPWFANQLKYFLERDGSSPFSEVIADHWHRGLGGTQHNDPTKWPDVPEPIRDLDAQLRKKLIDNSQEGKQPLPLLGDRETGDFVLGYAQLTLMPVNKSKREAGVGAHSDKPAYGDVIITVGIAGQADVVLTKEAKSVIGSSTVVPILRRRTIKAAMAYCLYGQSRWKVKHDVLVSDSVPPLDGLVMMDQQKKAGYTVPVARVAVTLRYFRRSWCELLRKARQPSPPLAPPPPAVEAGDIVDVFSFSPGGIPENRREYPYTYPAIVAFVDAHAQHLWVNMVSDGLVRDSENEASVLAKVPFCSATPSSPTIKLRCHKIPATQRIINVNRLLVWLTGFAKKQELYAEQAQRDFGFEVRHTFGRLKALHWPVNAPTSCRAFNMSYDELFNELAQETGDEMSGQNRIARLLNPAS